MQELTINGQVYQFNFGMGFLRDMNAKVSITDSDAPGVRRNVGARYNIARIIDGDVEALEDVLDTANKGQNPRLTKAAIDAFIDDENTNIDEVFDEVMGFLKTANSTRKVTNQILEAVENQKARTSQ